MPDTEPVRVELTADNEDLKTGLDQGKQALRQYGDEVEQTEKKSFKLVNQSRSLLGSVLAIRGAFSITTSVLRDFGIVNEQNERFLRALELQVQVIVVALQLYRAASVAVTGAKLAEAKAEFLAGIAKVSSATFFIGTAAVIAAAVGAWLLISHLTAPKAQFGGVIPPRPGGTQVIVGEAGQPEAIIPLNRAREFGFGGEVNVTMNVYSNDPDEIVRKLGRRLHQYKGAGIF